MNRVAATIAFLGLAAAGISAVDADERFSINSIERRDRLDDYARAVGLPLLLHLDHDELRLWGFSPASPSDVYGYVTDGKTSKKCHTTNWWSPATTESGNCMDTSHFTNARQAFALLEDLAKLDQRTFDCAGVMDGSYLYVEGRISGRLFAFLSGNPGACSDEASELVTQVLTLLIPVQRPAT